MLQNGKLSDISFLVQYFLKVVENKYLLMNVNIPEKLINMGPCRAA